LKKALKALLVGALAIAAGFVHIGLGIIVMVIGYELVSDG
jgi:hypothetical protein